LIEVFSRGEIDRQKITDRSASVAGMNQHMMAPTIRSTTNPARPQRGKHLSCIDGR
jgi:hypothetical protein